MVLGRRASTPSWRCIFGTRVIGASTVAAAGHFATVGSCTSHVSSSLGCAAMWVAVLLAATLVMVGLNAWRRHREQNMRDTGTAQQELSADVVHHAQGPQTGAAAEPGGDQNESKHQVYNPPPLVDQASGIISPFAAFKPLFDEEEESREAHAAAEPASPTTPACHRATDFMPTRAVAAAAAGAEATMPRVSADSSDVPSQPAALTPTLSEPARPQRTSLDNDERQQSLRYAASLASMLPSSPLNTISAATTTAAAGTTIASRAGSLLPSRSSIASSLSSLGSWMSSLLARVASAPPAVKHDEREEDAPVVQGRSPARASKDRQSLDSDGLPHTPLPLRKRGSAPSFPSAPSGGSTASLGSLLDVIQPAVLASGGDEDGEQRSSLKGLSRPASTLEMSAAVGALEFSDWEVSPAEIEICKRPDGSAWELGSGGFGKVYKALRYGVQAVAVKVLLGASSEARDSSLAEFKNEIAILRACKDPNIVTFLGACLQEEATMLITEYCEGGSLDRNIKRGKVNWYKRGKKVALDVAKGLVFLHSRRIVHFDLKSANILLKLDGTAKIADVGLSKVIGRELSAVTGHLGTLAWAAPEMLLGARCTSKADIYSYGVLLWEICTGETPMRGQMRDVRPPTECPYEVRELILSCLDPSPRARPSALQLVERLQAISSSPPPTAAMTPPASPLQPGLPSRSTPGGSPGPATAAAALAAAASSPAGPLARSPAMILGLPLSPVRPPAAVPMPAATAPAALTLSAVVHRGRPASLDASLPSPARPSPAASGHAATAGEEAVSFVGLSMPGSPFDSMTPGQEDPIAWGGMPEGRSAFGACPAYPAAFQMQEQRGLQLQGQQGSKVVASQQAGVSPSQPALSRASLPPRGPKAASLTSTPNTDRVRQAQHLQQAAHAQQSGAVASSTGSSTAAGATAAALASQELVLAPSAALQLACGLAPAAAACGSPALPPQPNPRLQRHPMRRQRSSPAALEGLDQVLDQMLQGMEGMCPANSSVIMTAIPQQADSGHTTQTPSHLPAPLLPPRPQDTLSAHYHHHYHCHQGHQLQYGSPSLFASAQPALRPAMSQLGSTPALTAMYSVPAHSVGTGESLPLGHGDPLAAAWLQPAIPEHKIPQAVPLGSAAASQAGPQKHGEVPKCQSPEVAAAGTVAVPQTAGLDRAAPDSRFGLGGPLVKSPTAAGSAREKEETWNRLLFNM